MKKILAIIVMLLFLAGAAIFYFQPFKQSFGNVSVYEAIPKSIVVLGSTQNMDNLLAKIDTANYNKQLKETPWLVQTKSQYHYLKDLLNKLDSNSETGNFNSFVMGMANAGSGNTALLTVIDIQRVAKETLDQFANSKTYFDSPYLFDGNNIYPIKPFDTYSKHYFTTFQNLLILSEEASLVEEALSAATNKTSIAHQTAFTKLLNDNKGQGDMNIFIHLADFSKLSNVFAPQQQIPLFESIDKLGDWCRLETSFFPDNVAFNGYTSFSDSTTLLYRLSTSLPSENGLTAYLPNNTAYFNRVGADESSYFNSSNLERSYASSWVDGEYAHFILESFDENYNNRNGLVVKAKDAENALISLKELAKENWQQEDSVFGVKVYSWANAAILNEVYPNALVNFEKAYIAIYKEAVFIAPTEAVIKSCIQKNKEGNTLSRDIAYTDYAKTIASKSNIQTYCQPRLMAKILNSIFKTNYVNPNALQLFSWQMSNVNGKFFAAGSVAYGANEITKTTKLWETTLKDDAITQPQLVINHNDKTKELIIQDKSNNFYLINNSGEIQFTIPLEETVMGKVAQIDFFKNGKLQYVFNTATKVYMIDRLGRPVADFPRSLPATATAPMLVADYGKSNYRFFIACDNQKVYGFQKDFKPLNGWSPLGEPGEVANPIQHTVIGGKDYIYYHTTSGVFYAHSRDGSERFTPVETKIEFAQKFTVLDGHFVNGAKGTLVKIDPKGVLSQIPMMDSTYQILHVPTSKQFSKAAYAWGEDEKFNLVRTQVEKLAAFNCPKAIQTITSVEMNGSTWFVLKAENFSYLVDQLGTPHPDSPLWSTAPISLEKLYDNKEPTLLLSGEGGKLGAYELKFAN